jgi:hypothetical protein
MELTPEIISAALPGYEAGKARVDEKISKLRGMLSGEADYIRCSSRTILRAPLCQAGLQSLGGTMASRRSS